MSTTTTTKFSRADYLARKCTHREYYSQFVSNSLVSQMASRFGKEHLKECFLTDEHLNNIPLKIWDGLEMAYRSAFYHNVKEAGDTYSQSSGVCILKESAKQAAEA